MVKHGALVARDTQDPSGAPSRFETNIHRNNGHEFDLQLLDSPSASVVFDLLTRDTYAPWSKPDEIAIDATVTCKHCGAKGHFSHSRRGSDTGSEREQFACPCGRCAVQLAFQFSPSTVFDVIDWMPVVGAAARAAVALAHASLGQTEEASVHMHQAYRNVVPGQIEKRRLLSEDGVLVKIAELLPVSNIFASLLHERAGHYDEASRALDLLGNWRAVGSPDGPLAKIMELFPGTDLVAFAFHVHAGSFAQALRAVTKARAVSVRAESATLALGLRRLECLDVSVRGLKVGPTQRFIVGALVDLAEDLVDRSSDSRRPLPSAPRLADGPDPLEALTASSERLISKLLADSAQRLEDMMPSLLSAGLEKASGRLAAARRGRLLPRLLLPRSAPRPRSAEVLEEALRRALRGLEVRHHDVLPTIDPVEGPRARPAGGAECEEPLWAPAALILGALAALTVAWILVGSRPLRAALVALAAAAAALAAAGPAARSLEDASRALASSLTVHNARSWSCTCGAGGASGHPPVGLGARLGLGIGAALPGSRFGPGMPGGVTVEVPPDVVEAVSTLARGYLLMEFLPLAVGWGASVVEPLARRLARRLFPAAASVACVIPLQMPEMELALQPGLSLRLPALRLAVALDVSAGASGPYVTRARAMVSDRAVSAVLRSLAAGLSAYDWRRHDDRMAGFTGEVFASFELGVSWPGPQEARLAASSFRLALHLPP